MNIRLLAVKSFTENLLMTIDKIFSDCKSN